MSRFKTYTDYHEGQDHLTTRKGFEHEGHWSQTVLQMRQGDLKQTQKNTMD